MKTVLDYKLSFFEKGEEKEKNLKIKFIANDVLDEYNSLLGLAASASVAFDKINELAEEKNSENLDPLRLKEIDKKIKEYQEAIREVGDSTYFDRRIKLIMQILDDNGIQDEQIINPKFWNRNVDATTMMNFLAVSVNKDVPKDRKKRRPGGK